MILLVRMYNLSFCCTTTELNKLFVYSISGNNILFTVYRSYSSTHYKILLTLITLYYCLFFICTDELFILSKKIKYSESIFSHKKQKKKKPQRISNGTLRHAGGAVASHLYPSLKIAIFLHSLPIPGPPLPSNLLNFSHLNYAEHDSYAEY